jgi:hypothetical protein
VPRIILIILFLRIKKRKNVKDRMGDDTKEKLRHSELAMIRIVLFTGNLTQREFVAIKKGTEAETRGQSQLSRIAKHARLAGTGWNHRRMTCQHISYLNKSFFASSPHILFSRRGMKIVKIRSLSFSYHYT